MGHHAHASDIARRRGLHGRGAHPSSGGQATGCYLPEMDVNVVQETSGLDVESLVAVGPAISSDGPRHHAADGGDRAGLARSHQSKARTSTPRPTSFPCWWSRGRPPKSGTTFPFSGRSHDRHQPPERGRHRRGQLHLQAAHRHADHAGSTRRDERRSSAAHRSARALQLRLQGSINDFAHGRLHVQRRPDVVGRGQPGPPHEFALDGALFLFVGRRALSNKPTTQGD